MVPHECRFEIIMVAMAMNSVYIWHLQKEPWEGIEEVIVQKKSA